MTLPSSLPAALAALLADGVAAGAFPAAACFVAADGRHRATAFAGGASPATRWDIASLTKPRATVDLAMRAVSAGALALDDAVPTGWGDLPLTDLLAHRAGLRPWADLAAAVDARAGDRAWDPRAPLARAAVDDALAAEVLAVPARRAPHPTRYSDLGYILLGRHLERRLGRPLRDLVAGYGGLSPPPVPERYAATGFCARRGRPLRGEVNDVNAWTLGGAAGHAGLFATVDALGGWALDLANAARGRPATLDGGVVRAFWDPAWRADGATWVLGWDTPTPGASTAGTRASPESVGHLGFTGASVWIDRAADLVVVLLSNRVALGPGAIPALRAFRPMFHDRIRDLVGR